MRFTATFPVLIFIILVNSSTAGLPLAGLIKLAIKILMNNIQNYENVLLKDKMTISIPEDLNEIMIGWLTLTKPMIYWEDSLKNYTIDTTDISVSDPDISKANVNFRIVIDKMGFSTGYTPDIGVLNELPIYGDGKLHLAISSVNATVNVDVTIKSSFPKISISDLNLQISFRDSPSLITGFWKSDVVSRILTKLLNIVEKFVCTWFDKEKDCINCILSDMLEIVINIILGLRGEKLKFMDCKCLKDNKHYNTIQPVLENMVISSGEAARKYLTSKEANQTLRYFFERSQYLG